MMRVKCMHAHVFIPPPGLCLLVEAFNPYTFKIIFDMYDLIIIDCFGFIFCMSFPCLVSPA